MSDNARPAVTFALFAYNQEQFIREAVEGALAQTYSPLQVVLSDDSSSDRTFEVMQKMAADYSGPHDVLLNRNERNLGVGGHVNRMMDLAKGDLIVVAAGDDVSFPNRVAVLVEQWKTHNKPSALCSGFLSIDEHGKLVGDGHSWFSQFAINATQHKAHVLLGFIKTQKPALIGCTSAWTSEVFEEFGPLGNAIWFEDNAISLRAWFLNGIHFVPERLVSYRQHATNISNRAWSVDRSVSGFRRLENDKQERAKRWVELLVGYEQDIETAVTCGLVDKPLANELSTEVARQIEINKIVGDWWSATILKRINWYLRVLLKPENREYAAWGFARLVPYELFLLVRALLSRARGWSRDLVNTTQSGKGG